MTTPGKVLSDGLTIFCVISAGPGSGDHRRVHQLMTELGATAEYAFVDRSRPKGKEILRLYRRMISVQAEYVFIEGTGIAAGMAAIASSLLRGRRAPRYIVSSGDAVSAYLSNRFGPVFGAAGGRYESTLYRRSWAFVGWTPYLVGRAIRMGAPRGVTVEGAIPAGLVRVAPSRAAWGIPDDAIVVGVTGSLNWSPRQKYTYGLELARAARYVKRDDVRFLIVGGGSGEQVLRDLTRNDPRFIFTGRVDHAVMSGLLANIDLAVIGQTADELGMLRLTTKLPEYIASGIPVAMPPTPGALDYLTDDAGPAFLMLPLMHPAHEEFARQLGGLIEEVQSEELLNIARRLPALEERFSSSRSARRLLALLEGGGHRSLGERIPRA